MDKEKSQKQVNVRRKAVRKERRLTVRFTEPLYDAIETRAYQENKSISTVIIESAMKFLDFKMPPKPEKEE
jgi:Skp family chaperone for outer membrane proteins